MIAKYSKQMPSTAPPIVLIAYCMMSVTRYNKESWNILWLVGISSISYGMLYDIARLINATASHLIVKKW